MDFKKRKDNHQPFPIKEKKGSVSPKDVKSNGSKKSSIDHAGAKALKEKKEKKLETYSISETYMYPDGNADFEEHFVGTIQAKNWEDAEKQAIKFLKLKPSDVLEVGADLGDNTVGYEFETLYHDATTGEDITEAQADKLSEEDEDLVSHTIHGFQLEKDEDDE